MKSFAIPPWDAKQHYFAIGNDYALERAEVSTWAIHITVSGLGNNIWFRRSWEQLLARFDAEDPCFWIKRSGSRIGGVFMRPNEIGCLYLEPPNTDWDQVLYLLKRVLLRWSDPMSPISTHAIHNTQAELFFRHGFRAGKQGRCLIRATEAFVPVWPDTYFVRPPAVDDTDTLVAFLSQAFRDTVDEETPEATRAFIDYYFQQNVEASAEHRASSVLVDRQTNEIVGECLVYPWEEWPMVGSIAVRKDLHGQGLASDMIWHALSTLHTADCPVLRMFSNMGNASASLYNQLGFVPGPLFYYEMRLPYPE